MEKMELNFSKLDNNQLEISDFIKKLDVKDKSALIMITTKLEAGMLLMSSTYGRYFQSILPFMVVARSKFNDDEKMIKIYRKKFSSMTRTYIRTNLEAAKEQPAVYALMTESYDIALSKEPGKQLESHVVITLADINDRLQNAMNQIHAIYINSYNESSFALDDAATDIADMTDVINATFEDIGKAFFDEDSNGYIDSIVDGYGRDISTYGYTITDLDGLAKLIKHIMNYLTMLYQLIGKVHTDISNSIDLGTPITMEDGKSFEELYEDFCKANDTAIKNDPQITGFSIPRGKKKNRPFFFSNWGAVVAGTDFDNTSTTEENENTDEE